MRGFAIAAALAAGLAATAAPAAAQQRDGQSGVLDQLKGALGGDRDRSEATGQDRSGAYSGSSQPSGDLRRMRDDDLRQERRRLDREIRAVDDEMDRRGIGRDRR